MTIQTKRKWILLLAVLLLAAALSVGSTSLWKAEKEKRGEGYVAVVRIDGAIYGGPETDSMLSGSSGSSSEEIMRELQEARKDPQAKAILIRINSPGGSTGATQEIAEEMDKIRSSKKPIVISMGDMCASAGYWLASKGNYIFASPATMTGSIGVYMDYTNIEDLMENCEITVASAAPCTPIFISKIKIGSKIRLQTAPIDTVIIPILAKPCALINAFIPRLNITKSVPHK